MLLLDIQLNANKSVIFKHTRTQKVIEIEIESEKEPLLSAATQWVTELFKFIEKVPPFSAIILCKDSRE